MTSFASRLAIVDNNRKITEKRLKRRVKKTFDAKRDLDKFLIRCVRKNQIFNLETRMEKVVTRSGRIILSPVTTFDRKPPHLRTRHFEISYPNGTPHVCGWTDHGPGRHHARPYDEDLSFEGTVKFYREEITR